MVIDYKVRVIKIFTFFISNEINQPELRQVDRFTHLPPPHTPSRSESEDYLLPLINNKNKP